MKISANKELSVKRIDCGESFQVKLSLKAERSDDEKADEFTKPVATDIVIKDTVEECFKIKAVSAPSKGEAKLIDSRSLEWKIDKLEEKDGETFLVFTVEHVGSCCGEVKVNKEVTYRDKEGNKVTFPSPKIDVDCGIVVCSERCPEPKEIIIGGCEDFAEFDAGAAPLTSLGRILSLTVTIPNVCPHKRVALAVILTETDNYGKEFKRGVKFIEIPAHDKYGCRDVKVKCIRFILPETLDKTGSPDSICNSRKFKVRLLADYIDSGFECEKVI